MAENCKNCATLITDNFCGSCGQKIYRRIDKKYIFEEFQYLTIHTNKGFFYTIKNLIKNPGRTAREFVDGNRVKHYKPLGLAFVLSGISALITFKLLGLKETMNDVYSTNEVTNTKFMHEYVEFISGYFSFIMLLSIPMFALLTKLAFRKWGHNYFEHIVMNSYFLSFFTILSILVAYPLMYLFKSDSNSLMLYSMYSILAVPFLLTWFFKGFYSEKPMKKIIGKILVLILYSLLLMVLIGILFIVLGIIASIVLGPETMKQLLQK